MTVVVERTTALAAPAEEVWRHATSMAGVNAELAPIRMTYPADRSELQGPVPIGEPLFTSTLKLGPVPFDRHELRLVGLEPGRWFQEDSRSLLHRRWRHRREVRATALGCELTDVVEVDPRIPGSAAVTRRLVDRIFARRHRVVSGRFGG